MLKDIEDYEQKLYDLWDNGVSPTSEYFKRELANFVKLINKECECIDLQRLKLVLLEERGLSKEEAKILTFLSSSKYIVKITKKDLCAQLDTCSKWMILAKLSILEGSNIIRTQIYGKVRIMYIHPRLIEQWNSQQKL
jgi:hypothetical protein